MQQDIQQGLDAARRKFDFRTPKVIPSWWPDPATGEEAMSLDNGKAKVIKTIEWFDDRVYKVLLPPDFSSDRWEFFWSVTSILGVIAKPWLTIWYGNLGTERARYQSGKARDRGSLIHNAIAEALSFDDGTGLGAPLDGTGFRQEDWLPIVRFAQWYNSFKPRVLGHDFPVVSYDFRFAGTLDMLIATDGGKMDVGMAKPLDIPAGNYVLDIKTGQENDDYFMQTSAYAQGVIENQIQAVQGTMILYLDTNTKAGYKLVFRNTEQMQQDFELFQSAQKLFLARGQKLPEVFEMPLGLQLARF